MTMIRKYGEDIVPITLKNIPDEIAGEITVHKAEDGLLDIHVPGIVQADLLNVDCAAIAEAGGNETDCWSGWFSNEVMLWQRVFTGNYAIYPYRRRDAYQRRHWEFMENSDRWRGSPDDEDWGCCMPDEWKLVDDKRLVELLDRMEIAVIAYLSSQRGILA